MTTPVPIFDYKSGKPFDFWGLLKRAEAGDTQAMYDVVRTIDYNKLADYNNPEDKMAWIRASYMKILKTKAKSDAAAVKNSKLKDSHTLHEFAWFWRNMYKYHYAIPFYNYKDGGYLGIALRDMGFEMDSGESYCKHFKVAKLPDLLTLKRQLPEMDIQLLGNLIFSQWRRWNHWSDWVKYKKESLKTIKITSFTF